MGNDTIIPYGNQFTHEGMGLDFATIPDDDIFLDFNERTDKTVIPYFTTVNVNGLDDSDILSEFHITDLDMLQCGFVHTIPSLHFFG
jgi:hypothetical protein